MNINIAMNSWIWILIFPWTREYEYGHVAPWTFKSSYSSQNPWTIPWTPWIEMRDILSEKQSEISVKLC